MRRTDDPILHSIQRARAKALSVDRRSKSAPPDLSPDAETAPRVHMAPPPKGSETPPAPVPEVTPPPVTEETPPPPDPTIKPFIDDVIIDADSIPDGMIEANGLLDFVLRRKSHEPQH